MKRLISIFTAVMCLAISCCLVHAEGELNDRQKEAVSLMNDLGIFQDVSEEGALNTMTRGEFAKVIVNMVDGADQLSENPKRIYTDVLPDNDAAASIEYLYNRSIMRGYDNAEFRPDSPISIEEAVTVTVTVLGYTNMAEYSGGWSDGYYSIASSNKLLLGVNGGRKDSATAADAAVLIQNALESKKFMIVNGFNGDRPIEETSNDKAYMSYMLDLYTYTGVVEGTGQTALANAGTEYKDTACEIGGEMFDMGDTDVALYLGQKVKVYYKAEDDNYKIVHIVVDSNNSVIDVNAEDIMDETTKTSLRYDANNRKKTLNINSNAIFIYNGKRLEIVNDSDLKPVDGSVRLISNDGDSRYDVVIIKEYNSMVVEKAVMSDSILHFKYGKPSLDLDDGTRYVKYYMDGAETDFSSIISGSVVSIAQSRNLSGPIVTEIYISNNKVSGTAKSLEDFGKTRKVILDDGNEYVYTGDYMQRLAEGQQDTYEPAVGSEGTFYIDYFNKLAGYAVLGTGKNYAYVVKCYYDTENEEGGIRLFTKEAEFIDLTFDKDVIVNDGRVKKEDILEVLKASSDDGTVNQLIIYNASEDNKLLKIRTAEDKTAEPYYVVGDDEFVLNDVPKNADTGQNASQRFYKDMGQDKPYCFVSGKTLLFQIPDDKSREKDYAVATKLATTDENVPAPVHIYDVGKGGNIGAMTGNSSAAGSMSKPAIVDSLVTMVDEDDNICTGIRFIGGTTVTVDPDVVYQNAWKLKYMDYSDVTVNDLERGDVVEYTMANGKVNKLAVIVKRNNIGDLRIDCDKYSRNGNMIAKVISPSENGRTALICYKEYWKGDITYQTMLVNGTVYRYDSTENQVYNSSTADLMAGDTILLNSFWWSPQIVVIYR